MVGVRGQVTVNIGGCKGLHINRLCMAREEFGLDPDEHPLDTLGD